MDTKKKHQTWILNSVSNRKKTSNVFFCNCNATRYLWEAHIYVRLLPFLLVMYLCKMTFIKLIYALWSQLCVIKQVNEDERWLSNVLIKFSMLLYNQKHNTLHILFFRIPMVQSTFEAKGRPHSVLENSQNCRDNFGLVCYRSCLLVL